MHGRGRRQGLGTEGLGHGDYVRRKGRRSGASLFVVPWSVDPTDSYSTGSAVSSAAIRSDRRNLRSFAVTSKLRRGCTTRAGAATLVSAADCCERFTKPTTASSVTFISNPAARA